MGRVTLRVLDGANRGTVFESLPTPITIGREEGNVIQLNDDRVSRFHVKLQEDEGKLVLTDLESTNGTRVNGEHTKVRILRPGDLIVLGRSLLLVGTREEIRSRLASTEDPHLSSSDQYEEMLTGMDRASEGSGEGFDWDRLEDLEVVNDWQQPPELPQGLRPGQVAELSELLEYLLVRIRRLAMAVESDTADNQIRVPVEQWQDLLDLQARLASYLHRIGDPDDA